MPRDSNRDKYNSSEASEALAVEAVSARPLVYLTPYNLSTQSVSRTATNDAWGRAAFHFRYRDDIHTRARSAYLSLVAKS